MVEELNKTPSAKQEMVGRRKTRQQIVFFDHFDMTAVIVQVWHAAIIVPVARLLNHTSHT